MRTTFFYLLLLLLAINAWADNARDMIIAKASIEKTGANKYRITVEGSAPTPGWNIKLIPDLTTGKVAVKGTGPGGMVIQVITPYSVSLDMELDSSRIKSLVVVGMDQTGAKKEITLAIPGDGKVQNPQSSAAMVEMTIDAEEPNNVRVKRGEIFLVWVDAKEHDFAKQPRKSRDFTFLGSFALGTMNGYVCRLNPDTNMRSVMVSVSGTGRVQDDAVEATAQIFVGR